MGAPDVDVGGTKHCHVDNRGRDDSVWGQIPRKSMGFSGVWKVLAFGNSDTKRRRVIRLYLVVCHHACRHRSVSLLAFAQEPRGSNVNNRFTTIQGSISMQAAFLVAFKQLVPEHTVTILKGLVQVRVKHFPAVFLATNTISGFVFGTDTASVLSWLGFLTSWTYLRFYKVQPDLSGASTGGSTLRGDASETFAFAYFWPDVVHAPVAALADGIYNLLVALKICTPFSAEAVESGNEQATARGEGGLPSLLNHGGARGASGQREEAERRRALALRALDQRLQAAAASRQQPITSASAPPLADSVEKATKNPSGF